MGEVGSSSLPWSTKCHTQSESFECVVSLQDLRAIEKRSSRSQLVRNKRAETALGQQVRVSGANEEPAPIPLGSVFVSVGHR